MAKVSVPGFIHATPAHEWDQGPAIIDGHRLSFFAFEDMSDSGWVMVCPHTMEFDIPEGWDPRAQQIDALKAQREKIRAEMSKRLMEIDEAISKLQAITYEPA